MTADPLSSTPRPAHSLFSRLTRIGVGSAHSLDQQRQIATTNLFSLISVGIAIPWGLVFCWVSSVWLALASLVFGILCAATLLLSARGHHLGSRLWLLLWSNVAILGFAVALGRNSGVALLFTATTCAPLALFDPRDHRVPFLLGVLTPVALGAAAERFALSHAPYLPLRDATLAYLFPALLMTTLLALIFIVSYYYYVYERSRASREREHRVEQARLDTALRESEELARQLVDQAADAVYFFDFDGRILEANQRASLDLGYTREELLSMSMFQIDRNLTVDELAQLTRHLSPARSLTLERVHQRKDGRALAVELRLSLFQHRSVRHLLASARDVSVRKEVEAQLMLADRMVSVGTLAAGVAHEVNNPLTSLLLNLELIERQLMELDAASLDAFSARVSRALQRAREGAERVGVIVRDLKTFSRGDAEVRDAVDLRRVIESTLNLAHPELKRRATVTTILPPDLPAVRANEARLGQVILNLLLNAAQAFESADPDRNQITVRVLTEGEFVVAEISDNGTGISEDVVSRIFDPFFTTKPVGVGTGLGLYICRNIIEACAGTLTCESELGRGTTFRTRIPSVRSLAGGTARFAPVREKIEATGARGSMPPPGMPRSSVLVIDPDPDMLQTLGEVLTGHSVELATDATRARSRLLRQRFELVLCDFELYQRSEDLLSSAVHEAPGNWVFLVTGSPAKGFSMSILNMGARFIDKPLRSEVLWELLRATATSTESRFDP